MTTAQIQIKHKVRPEQIQAWDYPSEFLNQDGFKPFFSGPRMFEDFIENGADVHLALRGGRVIVGYAVIGPSEEAGYWGRLGDSHIQEVVAVEVLRRYRQQGIAGNILTGVFMPGELDDKIVCLNGYVWTWDLIGTGISPADYKEMLMHFYGKFGFRPYATGEPNINLKPENFLMARIGSSVSSQTIEAFNLARFGI